MRAHGALDGLTDRERLLVEIARAVLRTRALPEDLFARGLASWASDSSSNWSRSWATTA